MEDEERQKKLEAGKAKVCVAPGAENMDDIISRTMVHERLCERL